MFDAKRIFVNNGTFEAGTEENPYTSKLVITLHGDEKDAEIPMYGTKVIGVREGTLDIHGCEEATPWTLLGESVSVGDTEITLNEEVQWKVGDELLLPSTSYDPEESEMVTIAAIDNSSGRSVITLEKPVKYEHYAETEQHGDEEISMRGQVARLTRCVQVRGDHETSAINQFGAHIMIYSPGDETTIGRIKNVMFADVGQAY